MQSDADTVEGYLADLPDDRRAAISTLRELILANLPEGYDEMMLYGMISYVIPLADYPDTYNGQPIAYLSLASQKRHMALYLNGVYGDRDADFRARYEATGRKLDMGKSCLRFGKLEDLLAEEIGAIIASMPVEACIAHYEASRERT